MIRMLFARLWRRLFWSKESRERLDSYLRQLDDDLEEIENILAGVNND
jgi:hypothetical protein